MRARILKVLAFSAGALTASALMACAHAASTTSTASGTVGSTSSSTSGTTAGGKPTGEAASATKQQTALFSDGVVATIYKDASVASEARFDRSTPDVISAVRLAYTYFEVPIALSDANAMRYGNVDFYRARKFAGKPMVELVQCGTSMTGPNAATFRIYMSLVTTVVPDGAGHAKASVLFNATARDIAESASNYRVPCASTGRLEQLMLEKVKEYLK